MYFKPLISIANFTLGKYRFLMLFLIITLTTPVIAENEIRTIGNIGADYSTLKAAFDAVNNGILTGNVTLRIIANTSESTSAVLNASNSGAANYSSVNIYPTIANLSVTGITNAPLIDLNGADNVVIDGRVNATGVTASLTISNTSISSGTTSTIRFINDATTNSIRFCQIKGSERSSSSGVIFFSTTTFLSGNDNNSLLNNEISSATDTNRPINVVYSEGNSGSENNNNTISGNNIFDFFSRSTTSYGINISANSTAFTISNNSFYETSTFIPTVSSSATYSFIYINYSAGSGFQILNNFIGGSAPQCAGSALTKTNNANNAFNGIYVAVGTNEPTIIDGNKISNIAWNNNSSGNWIGIQAQSGEVNIGSTLGNIIGETTGTSAIIFNSVNIGPNMYPIQINSIDNVSCISNKIGALNVINARYVICINKISNDGNTIIDNNTVGSSSTTSSIEVTTSPLLTTHFFVGIHAQGTSNIIKNNIISNLVSNSTGNGNVRGIEILSGSNTVSGNTISKVASASSFSTPLIGLSFSNSFNNVISGNSIIEIESTNAANINGSVIGMNLDFTGYNYLYSNFIRDIYVPSATTNTKIYGIKTVNGSATYSNNIIKLGTIVRSTIYGIFESGSQDCNMYHNTVYIDGSPTSGALNSFAFYSASNANTINYSNNIFINARSNIGASGKNYAAFFNYSSAGSLTLNYNVYYTTGEGGVLGYFALNDKTDLPIVIGQDANSLKIAPGFQNAGGSLAADYKPVITKFDGVAGTGITDDFGGAIRTSVPTIGAWEFAGGNMWKGSVSSDWGDLLNWTLSTVPTAGDNILFDPYPKNHLVMDADRTVNNITNSQSTYRIVVNGKRLTMLGALSFTNGAQMDASAINSVLVYSGANQQYINSSWLLNGEVYSIRLNNPSFYPVLLSGNLVLLGNISTSGGRLDANTNSTTVIYRGVLAQSINNNVFSSIPNRVYNLVIDNTLGVTINSPLIISNALTINSGKLLTISPIARLQVNGILTNNAGTNGLILNSTASGTASLIHSTSNVPATARRYIGGTSTAWHFLSSPIQSQSLSGDWKPTGTYSDGTGYDLYVWDEPTNCWVYNLNTTVAPTWNSVHPSTDFISGKGYLYALQAINTTKQFTGILNNGNISVNVSNSSTKSFKGFNFVGNPYPSSIDWKNNAGFSRNMLENTGGGYNIWIWSYTANNYGVFNSADPTDSGTNNSTRYISPNMGFFVKAVSEGTFVFSNLARATNEAGSWLRVKANQNTKPSLSIKVTSTDSLGSDEVKINFGSEFIQSGASKMYSPEKSAPSLFIKNENEDFSTYYLTTTNETTAIELNFKAGKNGKYTLSANELKNDFEVVLLEDKLTKKIIDLKLTENYTFTSKTTDNTARFTIHFNKTAITDFALNFANIYVTAKGINIDLKGIEGSFAASILDVNGVVLDEFTALGGEQKTVPIKIKGVVFLKLYNNEKTKTFKLLN